MHNRISTILTSLLCSSILFAQDPVSLEMEPIEANGAITAVTLYRGRAAVTRTTTLDLKAGGYSIFFRDLSSSTFLDTVQAHVSGNTKLLSVDTSTTPIAKDNSKLLAEINAEIKAVEAKIDSIHARKKANGLQISLLEKLIEQAGNDKAEPVDLDTLADQLDFVGKRMTQLAQSQIDNENELQELKAELQALMRKKNNISQEYRNQTDAIIDIGLVEAGTVEIEITYLVNNANWKPTYSIRASDGGNEIVIEYSAEISQRTGEHWTDVTLTLSTAQPQRSATPPKPSPWYVDVQLPQETRDFANSPQMRGRMRTNYEAADSAVAGGASMGLAELKSMVEDASAEATVVGDGPSVSFAIPRTVTIPSNAQEKQTTAIAAIEASAELYRIAAPMFTDSVFIQAKVTNDSPYILLPGQASIFHGSDYVGKAAIAMVAPNETFALNLGIDPSVTATRTLIEKNTAATGLFSSGIQTIYDYRISISNGRNESIFVHVWDRIPVSRNESIEILLENLSESLTTDTVYLESDRPRGLLRWDLTVPANNSGDLSYVLQWRVNVARGKDVVMTPLPE